MPINPGVRLVAEGSGDFILDLPNAAPSLAVNDEVVTTPDGGSPTTYKIEKVRYVVDYSTHEGTGLPPTQNVVGRTELVVSVP